MTGLPEAPCPGMFDVNYTLSKSPDTGQGVQNDSSTLSNPPEPRMACGPSKFDRKHIWNALFVYNPPARFTGLPAAWNGIAVWFREFSPP